MYLCCIEMKLVAVKRHSVDPGGNGGSPKKLNAFQGLGTMSIVRGPFYVLADLSPITCGPIHDARGPI